jgi:hypothetical protein
MKVLDYLMIITHYQKIDKYKWKFRGKIFVSKLPTDFTDETIPSVFTDEITLRKNH